MMCSRFVKTTRPIATISMLRIVSRMTAKASWTNFPVRDKVVWADKIAGIYVALWNELVDVDGSRGFERNVFKLVLRHFDIGISIDLVPLHDVFVRNFLASISIHLHVLDAVAGVSVDLVETDFLGIGSGRIQSDRTGNKRKAQKALPVGAGGHSNTPKRNRTWI